MKKKALGLMLLVAGLGLVAQAITNTAINASTNWSAAGAWSGVGIPNGPGDYAILYRNIGTQNKITTNDISVTLGGLSIGATAANNKAVTLTPTGGSTITFTNIGGGSASILKGVNTNTAATGTDVINTPLILGVNLNITNASTYGGLNIVGDISETGSRSVSIDNPISSNLGVTLSGSNSYSGGTILNSGKLLLGHGAALGTGALTVSGDSSLGTTAAVTFSNNIAMNANLNFVNANNMVADGNISGNGTLTKSGTGTLNLGGANNTYSGGTEITTGVLQYGPGKLGSGNITMSQGTTIQGGLGAGILTNNITLLGSVNIGAQQNMNLSGVISGNFGITNKNSATTTLSGENTYTGDTTVGNATFLSVSKDSNLGAGTNINMNQNAKLTTTASFGTSKTITLNDVGANQDISAASGTTLTLNGKITGGTNGASMRLTGLGTVVYAAANDHKAGTTVASTTLRLTGAGTINDGSAKVTLNAGTVDLGGTTQTIGGLMFIGGASYLSNGNITVTSITNGAFAGGIATVGANLHGAGATLTQNQGTLILNGINDFTGATAVTSTGTLSKLVVNGSTLSDITVGSWGTLGGSGTVAAVTMQAGSTLAAGNSPGTLTFTANATLEAGSTNIMEIYSASLYDVLNGSTSNTLALAGVNQIDFTGWTGGAATNGTTFNLFQNWDSINTNGATFTFLNLANAGLTQDQLQATGTGFTVIPEPATIGMLGLGALMTFMLRRMRTY